MKNKRILVLSQFLIAPLLLVSFNLDSSEPLSVHAAYAKGPIPTCIDLNDTPESIIRNYYKTANGLNGNALLIKLKNILKTNQQYYKYDDSNDLWKIYEIADRDWTLSPATSIPLGYGTYDATNNVIKDYKYGTGVSTPGSDPYVRALYVNREPGDKNIKTAWGSHARKDENCIEREHIWPKSRGFKTEGGNGARGDPMNLLSADGTVNGKHSNLQYGYVDLTKTHVDISTTVAYKTINISGNYTGTSKTLSNLKESVFEPQDADKGDIARACFYMVARYNNLAGDDTIDMDNPNLGLTSNVSELNEDGDSTNSRTVHLGILDDLLEWNRIDPPDEFEIHRNNLLYTNYTKNRNPFIDFPQWAEVIWGNNKSGKIDVNNDKLNSITTEQVDLIDFNLTQNQINLSVGDTKQINATFNPVNASNKKLNYASNNSSVASVSASGLITANKVGSATITVSSDVISTVRALTVNVSEATQNVPVTNITLSPNNVDLEIGQTLQTTISVEPSNATNKNVEYFTSNGKLATVDELGLVTAKSEGVVYITAKSLDQPTLKSKIQVNIVPTSGGGGGTTPGTFKPTTIGTSLMPHTGSDLSNGKYFIAAPIKDQTTKYFNSKTINSKTNTKFVAEAFNENVKSGYFNLSFTNNVAKITNEDNTYALGWSSNTNLQTASINDAESSTNKYLWDFNKAPTDPVFSYKKKAEFLSAPYNVETLTQKTLRCLILKDYGTDGHKFVCFADSKTNLQNADTTGIYMYRHGYVYDLLLKELEIMDCNTMALKIHNDNINRLYNLLSENERSHFVNETIVGSNKKYINAKIAYDYANEIYQKSLNTPTNLKETFNENISMIILISSLAFVSLILGSYVVFNKKRQL